MKKILKDQKGFTMIEILAVVIILALLLAVAVPAISKQVATFRGDYYDSLEVSVKSAGEDYFNAKRFSRPTELLGSEPVMVDTLVSEGYLNEDVVDYNGEVCSDSYVITIKTSEDDYEYAVCLVCDNDDYSTVNSDKYKEELAKNIEQYGYAKDYCNVVWKEDDNLYSAYQLTPVNDEKVVVSGYTEGVNQTIKVSYGVSKATIESYAGMKQTVWKTPAGTTDYNDALYSIEEGETFYPDNLSELANKTYDIMTNPVKLNYKLPNNEVRVVDGYVEEKPRVDVVVAAVHNQKTPTKASGDSYTSGDIAGKLKFKLSVHYRGEVTKYQYQLNDGSWIDACAADSKHACSFDFNDNFSGNIKFRAVSGNEQIDGIAITDPIAINVDNVAPVCIVSVKSATAGTITTDNNTSTSEKLVISTLSGTENVIVNYSCTDSNLTESKIVDGSGNSYSVANGGTLSLPVGTYVFKPVGVDKGGNTSSSESASVVVKAKGIVKASIKHAKATPTRANGADYISGDVAGSLKFVLSLENEGTAYAYQYQLNNTGSWASACTASSNTCSFTFNKNFSGNIKFRAVDSSGNKVSDIIESSNYSINVDSVAPVCTVTVKPANGGSITTDNNTATVESLTVLSTAATEKVTFTLSCTDSNLSSSKVTVVSSGGTTKEVENGGSLNLALDDTYTITPVGVDKGGNTSSSESAKLIINTQGKVNVSITHNKATPSKASGDSYTSGEVAGSLNFALSITTSSTVSKYQYQLNGTGSWVDACTASSNKCNFTYSNNFTGSIRFRAVDSSGNKLYDVTESDEYKINIDTVAPVCKVTITSATGSSITTDNDTSTTEKLTIETEAATETFTFNVSCSDSNLNSSNIKVVYNGGSGTTEIVPNGGSLTLDVNDSYVVTPQGVDKGGNSSNSESAMISVKEKIKEGEILAENVCETRNDGKDSICFTTTIGEYLDPMNFAADFSTDENGNVVYDFDLTIAFSEMLGDLYKWYCFSDDLVGFPWYTSVENSMGSWGGYRCWEGSPCYTNLKKGSGRSCDNLDGF